MELFESLQGFVSKNLTLLADVNQAWQPSDYLPDLTGEDWSEQLQEFRAAAATLPDEFLVVLVGNMVTEEALPSYSIRLQQIAKDKTGCDDQPWARWLRGWTAEENRHGDLLNAYLRLTGRVDMRAIERTIHSLIQEGFNPRTHGDEPSGLIYAAFQERATRISHGNVARLANEHGDKNLSRICRRIAGDESRHETFYTRVVGEMLENDPERIVLSIKSVLRGLIAMPGRKMFDGQDPDLFDHFATVSQRIGAYTARDYAAILRHLVDTWEIGKRSLTGRAAKAQEYLCQMPERYENLAESVGETILEQPHRSFTWIHGRTA